MEENPRERKYFRKWFLRIFLLLIVLSFVLFLWKGDYLLEKAVTDKLYESYFDVPTGIYDYQLEELDINVYSRSISMENLKLFPKKEFLDETRYKEPETSYLSVFSVRSLDITGLRLIRFIRKGELYIGGFEIAEPVIQLNIISPAALPDETVDTIDSGSSGIFSKARIDRLQITDADVKVYELSDNLQLLFSTDSTSLILRNISLDTTSLSSDFPIDFRSIEISSRFLTANLPDKQSLTINRFSFNSDEEYLYTDTFMFKTQGFTPESGRIFHGEDAFQIAGRELNILGFDLKSLYREKAVAADEFRLDGLSAIYYKKNESAGDIYEAGDTLEMQLHLDSSPLPSAIIRNLSLPLSLRDILINDASLDFKQFGDVNMRPAEMSMTDLNIRISDLSNDQRAVRRNQTVSFKLEGKIYDTGSVRVDVDIPLGEESDRMDLYFKLASMPFSELNRIAESTGMLRIRSGFIDSLECSLTLNRDSAWGDMAFVYHDLHIRLMKEIDRRRKLQKKRRILTLAANGLIKNNNDPARSSYRQGDIRYLRAPDESFSSFLTFSLVQGLAGSLAPAIEDRIIDQEVQE